MTLPIARTRLLDRNVQTRSAWLCILVTEGELTERHYFEGLKQRSLIDYSRVHVEVVPADPERHDSAPNHVCARADRYVSKYALDLARDQLWLVLDVDDWGSKKLASILTLAKQKGYGIAVSNPCFEVWLLLHLTDEVQAMGCAADCVMKLREILGSFNKANLDTTPYTE